MDESELTKGTIFYHRGTLQPIIIHEEIGTALICRILDQTLHFPTFGISKKEIYEHPDQFKNTPFTESERSD